MIPGQRVGLLTAVEFLHMAPRHGAMWKFRCDCGRTTVRRLAGVVYVAKRGHRQMCGPCAMLFRKKVCATGGAIAAFDVFHPDRVASVVGAISRRLEAECGELDAEICISDLVVRECNSWSPGEAA